MTRKTHPESDPMQALRRVALRYPETQGAMVCTRTAFKARNKAFLFMGSDDSSCNAMVKKKKQTQQSAEGATKEFFADGTLSGEGRLRNGKRHGRWKFYYRKSQVKAVGKYVDGELDGNWQWWRENGQPLQAGAFKNGVQVGQWKRYYHDGQLWDEGAYEDGKKVGQWTTYDETGAVKQQKTYKAKA